jgi:hypothetical protein
MSRSEPASPTPVVPLDQVARFTSTPIGPVEIPSWERERLARFTQEELEGVCEVRPIDPFAYTELTRRRGWAIGPVVSSSR